MPGYQTAARRPIADVFRATARGATRFCVCCGIHADAISCFSLVAAGLAARAFWQSSIHSALLIVAPLFCLLRLWCNMLDGMVALAAGQANWRGEVLNDLPDRASDVLIFVGAAHSGWMHPLFGYWAAIMSLGTAYVGMLGQAVGVQREFSGWMSKPWRMAALGLGGWLTYALLRGNHGNDNFGGLTVLEWTCVPVIAGCVQTSAHRLSRILRALKRKSVVQSLPFASRRAPAFLLEAYARQLRGAVRVAVLFWFGLIGLSPLLTRQHHVIDIVGGFALAAGCFLFIRPKFCLDSRARSA